MWRIRIGIIVFVLTVVGVFAHIVGAQDITPTVGTMPPKYQRVIIVLKSSIGLESRSANTTQRLTRRATVRQLQSSFLQRKSGIIREVTREFTLFPMIVATIATNDIPTLQADPSVESVQIDGLSKINLNNSTQLIGSAAANSAGYGGGGTTVAVLDTGVDKNHPFIAGQVIQEACFSSNDSSWSSVSLCPGGVSQSTTLNSGLPCPENYDGCAHGTHVAGIVAGNRIYENGATISGVAPDAKIIAVQIFSGFDHYIYCSSECALSFDSDQMAALQWLYDNRTTAAWHTLAAVNMSLGGGSSQTFCDNQGIKFFIDQLRSVGVATVIASGNGYNTNGVSFPACVSSAITVGSTISFNSSSPADSVSSFSNAPKVVNNLPNGNGDRVLDLLAPGQNIYSSVGYPANQYESWAGTSMATPHVAGAWAVLKGLMPEASVLQVLKWLRDSGVPVADQRMPANARLVVPRIQVDKAVSNIQNATHSLQLSTSALDFGQVRAGDVVTRQIIATSPISTTFSWAIQGNGFGVAVPDCEDSIDYSCTLHVTYTSSSTPNNINETGVLTVTWGGFSQAIGLVGRTVLNLPSIAQTQTKIAAQTTIIAGQTSTALKIRSVTLTATPTSHAAARTVVAWATRTQRMRNYQATIVRQTWTALIAADRMTATKERLNGLPSRTRTATATMTASATVLPLTKTIGAITTATRVQQLGITTTRALILTNTRAAQVAMTSTRQRDIDLATQEVLLTGKTRTRTVTNTRTTTNTWTVTNTRVTFSTTRTPSRTWTPTKTQVTFTTTRTATRTRTATVTPTSTPGFIAQSVGILDQPYQAVLALPATGNLVVLHQGDIRNGDVPQLEIIDPLTMNILATQDLVGINGQEMTLDPQNPLQIIVAGRLNWQSNYVQIYDVRTNAFALIGEFTFATSENVTSLYATNQTLYVGQTVINIPSLIPSGQIISIDLHDPAAMQITGTPFAVAGIPNAIVGIDDSDSVMAIAGALPLTSGASKGFVQGIQRRNGVLVTTTSVTLPYEVQSMARRSTLVALQRTNFLYAGDDRQLTQLTILDSTGAVVKYLNPIFTPSSAVMYIPTYDILVTAYYDTASHQDIFWSYELWQQRMWPHTFDSNLNVVATSIPAIASIDSTLYTLFGDHLYVSSLAGYTPIP